MHRKRPARMLPSVVAAAPGETEDRRGNPRPFDVPQGGDCPPGAAA